MCPRKNILPNGSPILARDDGMEEIDEDVDGEDDDMDVDGSISDEELTEGAEISASDSSNMSGELYSSDEETSEDYSDDCYEAECDEDSSSCRKKAKIQTVWEPGLGSSKMHTFCHRDETINFDILPEAKEIDYFKMFFDEELVKSILEETNRKFRDTLDEFITATKINITFFEVTIDEMYTFIGLCLLTAINGRLSLSEHWATNSILSSDIYPDTMPWNRFQTIFKMLHFVDNAGHVRGERYYKIQPLVDKLRKTFQPKIYPEQHICIEEFPFIYSEGKSLFTRMKIYALWDLITGYIFDFTVRIRKPHEDKKLFDSNSEQEILELLKPYFNRGHSLYTKQLIANLSTLKIIKENGMNVSGLVERCKIGLPKLTRKMVRDNVHLLSYHNDILQVEPWAKNYNFVTIKTYSNSEESDEDLSESKEGSSKTPVEEEECQCLFKTREKTNDEGQGSSRTDNVDDNSKKTDQIDQNSEPNSDSKTKTVDNREDDSVNAGESSNRECDETSKSEKDSNVTEEKIDNSNGADTESQQTADEKPSQSTEEMDNEDETPPPEPESFNLASHTRNLRYRKRLAISSVSCLRKSTKWYKKVFFHLLDFCQFNAYSAYIAKIGKCVRVSDFNLKLITQLVDAHKIPKDPRTVDQLPPRLREQHFPATIGQTAEELIKELCVVCGYSILNDRKKKKTKYKCRECDIPLCIVPCYKIFHTQELF